VAHNACPHETTGESPYRLAFGQDVHIPGWDLLERQPEEGERLAWLEARRALDLIHWQLKSQTDEHKRSERTSPQTGDVAIYKLPPAPTPIDLQHVSGVPASLVSPAPRPRC